MITTFIAGIDAPPAADAEPQEWLENCAQTSLAYPLLSHSGRLAQGALDRFFWEAVPDVVIGSSIGWQLDEITFGTGAGVLVAIGLGVNPAGSLPNSVDRDAEVFVVASSSAQPAALSVLLPILAQFVRLHGCGDISGSLSGYSRWDSLTGWGVEFDP
jgi:hypothetical protein